MTKQLQTSLMHRLLGLSPGSAPGWLYTKDRCGGLDVFCITAAPIIIGTIIAFRFGIYSLALLTLIAIFLLIKLEAGFDSCERFARARLRRHECVSCGEKLDLSSQLCRICERDS